MNGERPVTRDRRRYGARLLRILPLVAALLAGIVAGGGIAAAHDRGSARMQVQGLVTFVGNGTLQLAAPGAEIVIPIAKTTQVARLVTGSSTDISPGKWVDLHLLRGTRTADAVLIETRHPAPHPKPSGSSLPKPQPSHSSGISSGQVVSLSGNTLTVRCDTGQTKAYTLTSNTSITEELPGRIADLAVGEIVRVLLGRPGTPAVAIVIINA
jgi:hypothetical protein